MKECCNCALVERLVNTSGIHIERTKKSVLPGGNSFSSSTSSETEELSFWPQYLLKSYTCKASHNILKLIKVIQVAIYLSNLTVPL